MEDQIPRPRSRRVLLMVVLFLFVAQARIFWPEISQSPGPTWGWVTVAAISIMASVSAMLLAWGDRARLAAIAIVLTMGTAFAAYALS